ncbi:transferase family hexapeptide repeat protein [Rhizobium sp. PP-F2F-G36]|nr:transferase family hexapeptide repeat protein [Rhizobium sp. PP-F2F-G36]
MSFVKHLNFTPEFVNHLAALGIPYAPAGSILVHSNTVLEPPMSLFQINIWGDYASIGAFSYFGSGQFLNAAIGRYCSVGPGIGVGMTQHPVTWLTTSPMTYMNFINFDAFFEPEYSREKQITHLPFLIRPRTTLGNDVWVGANVYIKEGVKIGDGAIVAAHSVVTKDVDSYTIVGGNPARVIKRRFDEEISSRLLALKWWDYRIRDFEGIDIRDVAGSLNALEDLIYGEKIARYTPARINLMSEHSEFFGLE